MGMGLVETFGIGFFLGLVSSLPLGPINATFFASSLRREDHKGAAMATAVALLDGGYAFIALSATPSSRLIPPALLEWIAGLFLIGYGLLLLRPRATSHPVSIPTPASRRRAILWGAVVGAVLYISNPSFAAFWMGIALTLRLYLPAIALRQGRLVFALGVVAGVGLWFLGFRQAIRRASSSVTLARRAARGVGLLLIGLGVYLMRERLRGG